MGYFQSWVLSGVRCRLFLIHLVICLSLFCSNTGATFGSSNETDRLALLAFKAKITDDPFGIMGSWNGSTHFCQWYGVICSTRHQRVTQLNLSFLKLGGSISPHIGNLSFLHALDLQSNNLVRQIPPEIGRLTRLQMLNLRSNSLGDRIPLNLSSCSGLKSLSLSDNKLEGQIPHELGSLLKLQFLGAGINNLIGEIPPSLGNLTSLESMLLENNNLNGRIPTTLGNLTLLKILYLDLNNLSGKVPSSVFNLSSMEALDLGINQLQGNLPPDLFHTLPNIQFMSVANNSFVGPIPSSLSNASNLQYFQIPLNTFTGNVPSLGRLNMLLVFMMWGNQLGNGISEQDDLSFLCCLTNATSLKWLLINNNNFGGMLPPCITNLSSQLTHFSVSNNYIFGSIPPGIDNLLGLEMLDTTNNSFTGIIPSSIGNLRNLVDLYLSYNSFSGSIPSSLGKLSNLNLLQLSTNTLNGTIPSDLQNCTSLQGLTLDRNNLTGFIPPQILTMPSLSIYLSVSLNRLTGTLPEEVGKLTHLFYLDISSNMLTGEIPDSLGECTNLQYIYLDGNDFQGQIPSSLSSLSGLQLLDLSSNNLSGQIPDFLASFGGLVTLNLSFNDFEGAIPEIGVFTNATATSLKGNSKLCGGMPDFHLPKCSATPERNKRRLPLKFKVTISIVAGIVGVASLILLLSIFILTRKQRQSRKELVFAPSENPPLQFVSYGDLHRATNGFSQGNLVGAGSFGHVYRGSLGEQGQIVAIKVMNLKHHGANRSFVAECEALRSIRHRNLVKLLTVCSGIDYKGNEFKALVYEFMPNGSLEDWLHQPPIREDEVVEEQAQSRKLGLLERLGIAIDVASLLEYVHRELGTPLVHCDIKPSNILLDDDLFGHVSDFGLAKFVLDGGIIRDSAHPSSSTGVRGTVGYAPPEYGLGSEVSTQGDVYTYGILLLEMFTGKRPTHEMFKEGLTLHLYAKMALSSGVVNILDPTLVHLFETEDQVLNPNRSARVMDLLGSVIEIGVACSSESPTERMDISIATTKLQKVRESLSRGRN